MIVNDFREAVTTLIDDSISVGEVGTSSTAPSVTDTDLIAGNQTSSLSVTTVKSGQQIIVTYNLNSVTGNGSTYAEYGNFLDTGELLNRVVYTDLPKTEAVELQFSTVLQVV